ncbi:proteasome assembly chaperone 2-like [Zophobas morio]|uniref:proteasome assembly chaperone 2-like n=1 Tax=Zophobas morio TaxID=2755281 RepID=UPI00308394C0
MRSSVITPFRKEFVQQLLEWFQSEEMEKLILLSSSDLGNYLQERLLQSPFRCLCSASFTKSLGAKSSLLKNFWPDLKEDNFFTEINQYKNSRLPFSIGGITRTLYEECEKKNLSLVILIMFCAEGDNASEAFRFAQQMDAWLELRRKYQRKNRPLAEWNAPISWTAFYGSAASEIIY